MLAAGAALGMAWSAWAVRAAAHALKDAGTKHARPQRDMLFDDAEEPCDEAPPAKRARTSRGATSRPGPGCLSSDVAHRATAMTARGEQRFKQQPRPRAEAGRRPPQWLTVYRKSRRIVKQRCGGRPWRSSMQTVAPTSMAADGLEAA